MKPSDKENKEFDRRMKASIKRYLLMLFILMCVAYPIIWNKGNEDNTDDRSNPSSTRTYDYRSGSSKLVSIFKSH